MQEDFSCLKMLLNSNPVDEKDECRSSLVQGCPGVGECFDAVANNAGSVFTFVEENICGEILVGRKRDLQMSIAGVIQIGIVQCPTAQRIL